jgi:hypothetical protein
MSNPWFLLAGMLFMSSEIIAQTASPWPAPGSEDTELGVLMEPEVRHGEAEVHA